MDLYNQKLLEWDKSYRTPIRPCKDPRGALQGKTSKNLFSKSWHTFAITNFEFQDYEAPTTRRPAEWAIHAHGIIVFFLLLTRLGQGLRICYSSQLKRTPMTF